jgi:hypothetical protein
MRNAQRLTLLAAFAAALALSACEKAGSTAPLEATLGASNGTDLSGTWVLNESQSDKPPSPPQGQGDHPQPPGGQPPGEAGQDGQPHPPGPMGPPRELTIAQTATTVTFRAGDHPLLTLKTDGSTTDLQGPDGHTAQVSARWQDGVLVVTRSGDPRGGTMTERFSLSGSQLVLQLKPEGGKAPPNAALAPESIRLVYDKTG